MGGGVVGWETLGTPSETDLESPGFARVLSGATRDLLINQDLDCLVTSKP